MKKYIITILVLCTMLCACSNSENDSIGSSSNVSELKSTEENIISQEVDIKKCKINGADVELGTDINNYLDELGDADNSEEWEGNANSCYSLSYGPYDISINTIDGVETITAIWLSDGATTTEGIGFDSSKQDILSVYGDPDEDLSYGDDLGYSDGDVTLQFGINSDGIYRINYELN